MIRPVQLQLKLLQQLQKERREKGPLAHQNFPALCSSKRTMDSRYSIWSRAIFRPTQDRAPMAKGSEADGVTSGAGDVDVDDSLPLTRCHRYGLNSSGALKKRPSRPALYSDSSTSVCNTKQ